MHRFWAFSAAVLALSTVLHANAAEKIKLFGDYWYGQPLDEVRQDFRAHVFTSRFGRNLLALDTTFMGLDARLVFVPFDDRDVGSNAEESAEAARKFENFGIKNSDLLINFVERSAMGANGNPGNADDLEARLDKSVRTVELLVTDKIIVLQFETAGEPDTLDILDVEPANEDGEGTFGDQCS